MMATTHYAFGALFTAAAVPIANEALDLGLGPGELLLGVGIGTLAGVLPDIDHPDSAISNGALPGLGRFGFLTRGLAWVLSIPPRIVGVAARTKLEHRGGTHSLPFLAGWTILAAPLYALAVALALLVFSFLLTTFSTIVSEPLFQQQLGFDAGAVILSLKDHLPAVMPLTMLCVFCGYLSHLFSDSLTSAPVPWLWPMRKRGFFFLPPGLRIKTNSLREHKLVRPLVTALAVVFLTINIAYPMVRDIASPAKPETSTQQKTGPGKKTTDKKGHRSGKRR